MEATRCTLGDIQDSLASYKTVEVGSLYSQKFTLKILEATWLRSAKELREYKELMLGVLTFRVKKIII
jgi:hypothetical protein